MRCAMLSSRPVVAPMGLSALSLCRRVRYCARMTLPEDTASAPTTATAPKVPGLEVLAYGEGWLAVNKPSGLLSVPGRTVLDSVLARVRSVFPPAEASHRLDMDTSGVLVVGIRRATHRALSTAFRERDTKKRYVAVVWGVPEEREGTIDLPIGKDWDARPRQRIDMEKGKPSETRYRVLETYENPTRSAVDLGPVTGRTHQLRVHMAAIGCPVLGDHLYASPEAFEASDRLLLHAVYLGFPDPIDGHLIEVSAPIPFEFPELPEDPP